MSYGYQAADGVSPPGILCFLAGNQVGRATTAGIKKRECLKNLSGLENTYRLEMQAGKAYIYQPKLKPRGAVNRIDFRAASPA